MTKQPPPKTQFRFPCCVCGKELPPGIKTYCGDECKGIADAECAAWRPATWLKRKRGIGQIRKHRDDLITRLAAFREYLCKRKPPMPLNDFYYIPVQEAIEADVEMFDKTFPEVE